MSGPAKRRFGQHFLAAPSVVDRIVAALDPRAGDAVLEIGPGRGALTAPLLARCERIAAVELDRDLYDHLKRRFRGLVLFERDVLELPLAEVRATLKVPGDPPLSIVGNLPYNVSKPIVARLVAQRRHVARAVLMFQREVAQRLTARPGGRNYGALTVLVGAAYHVEALFDVSPKRFRPAPAVVSSVTRWEPLDDAPDDGTLERLRAVLSACFRSKRRTLRNNLRAAAGTDAAADDLLERCGLDGRLRAEALPIADFLRLTELWPSSSSSAE